MLLLYVDRFSRRPSCGLNVDSVGKMPRVQASRGFRRVRVTMWRTLGCLLSGYGTARGEL